MRIEQDNEIIFEVKDGCINCPFSKESICGADEDIESTHNYTYPAKCPLLKKEQITVTRIIKK